MELSKKTKYIFGGFATLLISGGAAIFAMSEKDKIEDFSWFVQKTVMSQEDEDRVEAIENMTRDYVSITINHEGVTEERGARLRKDQENMFRFRFTGLGTYFEGLNNFILNNNLFSVGLEQQGEIRSLECALEERGYISCPFTLSSFGKRVLRVSLKHSDISYEIPLVVKDPSFIFVSLGLSKKDLFFNLPYVLQLEDVNKIPAYEMGDDNHEYSKGFPRPDLPETLRYTFTSETKEFSSAFLEVYSLPEGLTEGEFPVELTDEFVFPQHITRLGKALEERPQDIGNEQGSIVYFPRVNATPIAIFDEKYFENDFFTGVRYTIQYTQAVAPADFPTYTFQGITRDKKYFIFFRYAKLYSPQLERVLQKESREFVAHESKFNEYIKESFEELYLEQNFSPTLSELDAFVQSLRIDQ